MIPKVLIAGKEDGISCLTVNHECSGVAGSPNLIFGHCYLVDYQTLQVTPKNCSAGHSVPRNEDADRHEDRAHVLGQYFEAVITPVHGIILDQDLVGAGAGLGRVGVHLRSQTADSEEEVEPYFVNCAECTPLDYKIELIDHQEPAPCDGLDGTV